MGDEARWAKVREIVREECERIEAKILAVLEKHGERRRTRTPSQIQFVEGRWLGITSLQMITWREAYPSVDIEQDLKRAASHLVSTGKPVIKYGQFIDNWLKKSQNFSSIRSIPNRNEPGPGKKLCAYCEKQGTGSVGGIWHCNEHIYDAMDQKPIPRMRDVTAKPVSGS